MQLNSMCSTVSYCLNMELSGAIVLKDHSQLFTSINLLHKIELLYLSHRLARHNNFVSSGIIEAFNSINQKPQKLGKKSNDDNFIP